MDRLFARRRFLITLWECSAVMTRNCWWIFRVNFPELSSDRVLLRSEGVRHVIQRFSDPEGPLPVQNRLTPAGMQLVTKSAKSFDVLFVKWLGILSTKSCFRMVGRPIIKSMLVSIVLAIRDCSSSVILLKFIKQKQVEHFIFIANYHSMSCWQLLVGGACLKDWSCWRACAQPNQSMLLFRPNKGRGYGSSVR